MNYFQLFFQISTLAFALSAELLVEETTFVDEYGDNSFDVPFEGGNVTISCNCTDGETVSLTYLDDVSRGAEIPLQTKKCTNGKVRFSAVIGPDFPFGNYYCGSQTVLSHDRYVCADNNPVCATSNCDLDIEVRNYGADNVFCLVMRSGYKQCTKSTTNIMCTQSLSHDAKPCPMAEASLCSALGSGLSLWSLNTNDSCQRLPNDSNPLEFKDENVHMIRINRTKPVMLLTIEIYDANTPEPLLIACPPKSLFNVSALHCTVKKRDGAIVLHVNATCATIYTIDIYGELKSNGMDVYKVFCTLTNAAGAKAIMMSRAAVFGDLVVQPVVGYDVKKRKEIQILRCVLDKPVPISFRIAYYFWTVENSEEKTLFGEVLTVNAAGSYRCHVRVTMKCCSPKSYHYMIIASETWVNVNVTKEKDVKAEGDQKQLKDDQQSFDNMAIGAYVGVGILSCLTLALLVFTIRMIPTTKNAGNPAAVSESVPAKTSSSVQPTPTSTDESSSKKKAPRKTTAGKKQKAKKQIKKKKDKK